MITYPVDVPNTKWAVLKLSTGEIIARNKTWPVADGSAIVGLDPDFVYLLQTRDTEPDYDSRLYYLQATEEPDAEANTLHTSFESIARAKPERIAAAENVEREKFNQHFQFEKLAMETAIMVGLIYHFAIDNQSIPARFTGRMEAYKNKVKDKILPNLDNLDAILAQIEADNDPDLDAGWSQPDA